MTRKEWKELYETIVNILLILYAITFMRVQGPVVYACEYLGYYHGYVMPGGEPRCYNVIEGRSKIDGMLHNSISLQDAIEAER